MSRLAPDARGRLAAAALDLFVENGSDDTTVAQIADRAGLNRATFFRHFTDKREVLFGGADLLSGLCTDAVRAVPLGDLQVRAIEFEARPVAPGSAAGHTPGRPLDEH